MTSGFSGGDLANPPSKTDIRREEREARALQTYYKDLNLSDVRRALKLASNREALVWVNRAHENWQARQDQHTLHLRHRQDTMLNDLISRLFKRAMGTAEDGSDADMAAIDRLHKLWERQSKLMDLDAGKNIIEGPQVVVIDARPPWSRDEVVDAEVVEIPELGDGA